MDFLKKNYEKVLLFALFVIFAILLVHLYFIVQSTREVKDEHLEIPTREPDYVVAQLKDDMFNFKKLFETNTTLPAIGPRDSKDNKDFSDLISIFKIARCGKCKHLIPRRIMESSGNCTLCQAKLLPPKKEENTSKITTRLDHDEDGIPNVVELLFGLDPYNANDALDDLDGDGFVNVYEYQALQDSDEFKKIFSDEYKNISNDEIKNMSLKNPKVHPPLATGLVLDKIDRQKLNVNLRGVTTVEGMPKEGWYISIEVTPHPKNNLNRRRKRRLEKVDNAFKFIGQKINLVMGEYTIVDMIKDANAKKQEVKKQDPKAKDPKAKDPKAKDPKAKDPKAKDAKANEKDEKLDTSYYVVLQDKKGRRLNMRYREDTYDLEDEALFRDVWSDKKYSGKVGNTITMGNSIIGVERYKIKSINKDNNSVVLERKGMKDIVVRRKSIMPPEFIPKKDAKKDTNETSEKIEK